MIKPPISAYLAPPTDPWREPYPVRDFALSHRVVGRESTDDCASLLASSVWMVRIACFPPNDVVREATRLRPDLVDAFDLWRAMATAVVGPSPGATETIIQDSVDDPDIDDDQPLGQETEASVPVEVVPDEEEHLRRGEYARAAEIRAERLRPRTPDRDISSAIADAWRIRQALGGRAGETFVLLDGRDHREAFGPASKEGRTLYGGIRRKVAYPFRLTADRRLEQFRVEPGIDARSFEDSESSVAFDASRLAKAAFATWDPSRKRAPSVARTIAGADSDFLATVLLALVGEGHACAIARMQPVTRSAAIEAPSRVVVDLRGVMDRATASVALARATWHLPRSTLHVETCDPAAGRQTFVVMAGRVIASFVEGSPLRSGPRRLDERVGVVGPDGDGSRIDRRVAAALARFARSAAAEARLQDAPFAEIEVAMGPDGPVVVSLSDCRGAWPELPDGIVRAALERARARALAACAERIETVARKKGRSRVSILSTIERESRHPLALERSMARLRHDDRMSELVKRMSADPDGDAVEVPIVALHDEAGDGSMVAAVIERIVPEGRLAFTVHPCLSNRMRRTIAGVLVADEQGRSTLHFVELASDETSVVVGESPSAWPFPREGRPISHRPARPADGLLVDLSCGFMLVVDPPRKGILPVRVVRTANGAARFDEAPTAPATSSIEVRVGAMENRIGRMNMIRRERDRRIVEPPALDEDDDFGSDVVLRTLAALDHDGEEA